jgi:hypothetical protein
MLSLSLSLQHTVEPRCIPHNVLRRLPDSDGAILRSRREGCAVGGVAKAPGGEVWEKVKEGVGGEGWEKMKEGVEVYEKM